MTPKKYEPGSQEGLRKEKKKSAKSQKWQNGVSWGAVFKAKVEEDQTLNSLHFGVSTSHKLIVIISIEIIYLFVYF